MKTSEHLEKYIPLYLYDELNKDERDEFELHVQYCGYCREQLDEMRALHKTLDKKLVPKPSEALLMESRHSLRERLREERKAAFKETWLQKLTERMVDRSHPIQWVGAAVLLVIGILIGRLAFMPENAGTPLQGEFADTFRQEESLPFMESVDLIQYDPNTGKITVQYKSIKEVSLQGNIEDPSIRKLLVYAIRTEEHPGRRLTAVKATGATSFSDEDLEDALIYAVQNDEVDGVRLRAAKVLSNLPINQKIKAAFIRVLLKDTNSAIRIEALTALSKVTEEADVLPVFQDASRDDANEFVRLKASRALERIQNPEIQNRLEDQSKENK
ncbi:MAG: HEAT repeat domain-containing protein [bacterium]